MDPKRGMTFIIYTHLAFSFFHVNFVQFSHLINIILVEVPNIDKKKNN